MKFLLLLNFLIYCKAIEIVQTQYGPIFGTEKVSALNKNYFSFQKIPYMKAPLGKLRFTDPQPPESWLDPLNCTVQGPRFPQIDFTFESRETGVFDGDLDSMHINVYTNDLNPQQKYPVMVWIHGGGFRTGSGLTEIYGPDYFIEKDIILVTFNYRLYTFGFLSLDDPELNIPGNAGFKDQVMALKWIKENIENFGGDSNNITIFGQSSGGGCAHFHTISDASRGLFQRSIIMSGSALVPSYAAIPRRNWAFRLAVLLNYTGSENEREILEFLELAEPRDIFMAVDIIMTSHERNNERLINAFGPVIEPYETTNSFMLKHPEELMEDNWGNDIDIMIGATSFEMGMLVPVFLQFPSAVVTDFETFVPYAFDAIERVTFGKMLKEIYYGQLEPSPTSFDGIVLISGDFSFWHTYDRIIKYRLNSSGSGKSYVYRFDANADNNCFRTLHNIDERWHEHHSAIHMDDLCYLFKPSFVDVPLNGSISYQLIYHMLSVFTSFASTGDPGIVQWTSSDDPEKTLTGYNIRQQRTLNSFGELPEMKRMEVWQKMYDTSGVERLCGSIILIFIVILLN